MATLTGPNNCAECGTEITEETILSGDAGPLTTTVRGHVLEVPGLYVCTPCAGAIMVGEKESSVTWKEMADYLNNNFAPRIEAFIDRSDDPVEILQSFMRLQEVAQVAFVLEAIDMLQHEDGGLDFIPECDGHCGHEHEEAHPRDMAPMN